VALQLDVMFVVAFFLFGIAISLYYIFVRAKLPGNRTGWVDVAYGVVGLRAIGALIVSFARSGLSFAETAHQFLHTSRSQRVR
jgi:uncharacterized membrane protein YuzA (DUF378 family)